MRVRFKMFKSSMSSWQQMFNEAADFANTFPADRLINISHSADQSQGVVVVWYWGEVDLETEE